MTKHCLNLHALHVAKTGFDPQMGARPMARLIQDTIRKSLADQLLFGKLVKRGGWAVELHAIRAHQLKVLGKMLVGFVLVCFQFPLHG